MTIPTIVTIEQVQAHLNLPIVGDASEYDHDLQRKIDAATQLVCEHISDRQPADPDWILEIESWGLEGSPENPPPPLIQLAVMETVADFYRFRGDDAGDDRGRQLGYLPLPVSNLLHRYRSPALA